mmetsp:Transcript_3778/g.7961  ORF Transcript_3778/g.7961 Transcript_3778/m.7961 type:complete len:217 (-) Transcript_3778:688-1338(-)
MFVIAKKLFTVVVLVMGIRGRCIDQHLFSLLQDLTEVFGVNVQIGVVNAAVSVEYSFEHCSCGVQSIEHWCRVDLHGGSENVSLELGRNLPQKQIQIGPLVDVHQIPIGQADLEVLARRGDDGFGFLGVLKGCVARGSFFGLSVFVVYLIREELGVDEAFVHVEDHDEVGGVAARGVVGFSVGCFFVGGGSVVVVDVDVVDLSVEEGGSIYEVLVA